MPKPFDSRKLWTVALTLGAICGVAVSGHATDSIVSAIVTVGGGGTGLQALLDFKHGKGG